MPSLGFIPSLIVSPHEVNIHPPHFEPTIMRTRMRITRPSGSIKYYTVNTEAACQSARSDTCCQRRRRGASDGSDSVPIYIALILRSKPIYSPQKTRYPTGYRPIKEGIDVQPFLKLSNLIDALNNLVGRWVSWLTLIAVLVSSGNATVRYVFDNSSNAWLELQWYLFTAIVLLCGGYTLLHHQHVRIDVVYTRFTRRTQLYIDVFGTLVFLLPMAILIMYLSWPVFVNAYVHHEMSSNAGGLIVWPARVLFPIGFFLLSLQGISELIKRIAILQGKIPDPAAEDVGPTAEEELARAITGTRGRELEAEALKTKLSN